MSGTIIQKPNSAACPLSPTHSSGAASRPSSRAKVRTTAIEFQEATHIGRQAHLIDAVNLGGDHVEANHNLDLVATKESLCCLKNSVEPVLLPLRKGFPPEAGAEEEHSHECPRAQHKIPNRLAK